ncbi:Zinc/iron permease [Cinara cedri]|uniref:Zinc/iron permease n=1 Tax=Cinara cedri TaxID=506608 RepID=A0A5E4MA20_9HEMI|nr:Zinc/iron permease [Cinara cedri]
MPTTEMIVYKTCIMSVLGFGSFMLGVLPMKLTEWCGKWSATSATADIMAMPTTSPARSHSRHSDHDGGDPNNAGSRVKSLLLCFGGGVLLFTTLLHLQPEVREGVKRLQTAGKLPTGQGTEHLGDMIFCAGFFLVFLVDEIVHLVVDRYLAINVDQSSAEDVLHRSMSLRRRTISSMSHSYAINESPNSTLEFKNGAVKSSVSIKELFNNAGKEKRYQTTHTMAALGDDLSHSDQPFQHVQLSCGDDAEEQMDLRGSEDFHRNHDEHSFHCLLTVIALSFHEIFEGIAIGLEKCVDKIWYLPIAVATHKLVIAFCIGLELAYSKTRRSVIVLCVATFAVVTPVGIFIGMVLSQFDSDEQSSSSGRVAITLQGLAGGTLLYVVFFEVLARHKQPGFSHVFAIMFGFCVLFVLQVLTHRHDQC